MSRRLRRGTVAIGAGLLAAVLNVSWVAIGAQSGAPAPDATAPAAPVSNKVRIVFQVNPPEKAVVMWARKPLGTINPKKGQKKVLIVERPRDSGPLDVVIRAKDFVPVHTRAYTFTDSKVYVKLTPIEEKKTIFGYKEELPDLPPDGGVGSAGGGRDGGAADR